MKFCQLQGCSKSVGFHLKKACTSEHATILRRQYDRERHSKRRERILEHYGNQCSCCGEQRKEFLALDHKYGDGQKHRRELKHGSSAMYRWIIKNNFPDMFQVLCHNCNMALGCLGYCPHEKERAEQGVSVMESSQPS